MVATQWKRRSDVEVETSRASQSQVWKQLQLSYTPKSHVFHHSSIYREMDIEMVKSCLSRIGLLRVELLANFWAGSYLSYGVALRNIAANF